MTPTSDDKLAASVFALGLTLGFVQREDVVRWADRRITEIEKPPMWLIDLSLSRDRHFMDLISDLNDIARGVDPVATCTVAFSLLPDTSELSFDDAEAMGKLVYQMARHCVPDWDNKLLWEADSLDDTFSLIRGGYIAMTHQEAITQLTKFLESYRDRNMDQVLHPAVWSNP